MGDWDLDVVVDGEPASAKNQRRIVKINNMPRLIKSKKALDYCRTFAGQFPKQGELIEGDVALRLDIWYASRRPDLAAQDLIMDLLQDLAYKNDRQVKAVMSVWNLDKDRPRVRIRLRRIQVESSLGLSSYKHSEIWGEDL
jgi:Holliday junction resolvase RusA-like endonuclease